MEKINLIKTSGFLAENKEKAAGVFCHRVTGEGKKGPYDNIQLVQVYTNRDGIWMRQGRGLSKKEIQFKKTIVEGHFPIHMLSDVIRALNNLYKDITGDTVAEADEMVKGEFDTTGEMMAKVGWKDRGR